MKKEEHKLKIISLSAFVMFLGLSLISARSSMAENPVTHPGPMDHDTGKIETDSKASPDGSGVKPSSDKKKAKSKGSVNPATHSGPMYHDTGTIETGSTGSHDGSGAKPSSDKKKAKSKGSVNPATHSGPMDHDTGTIETAPK